MKSNDIDLTELLQDLPVPKTKAVVSSRPTVETLKFSHHRIAKLLASGLTQTETAARVGCAVSKIKYCNSNPAFQDLVEFYRNRLAEDIDAATGQLKDLAGSAVAVLLERVENEPEMLKTTEIMNIAIMALDRTGHSPVQQTKNLNLNVRGTTEDLLRARQELDINNQQNIVYAQDSIQLEARPVDSNSTLSGEEQSETQGEESQGD